MQELKDIFESGITQGTVIIVIISALVYVWKRYEHTLVSSAKNSIKTYDIVKTIEDISKDTKVITNELKGTLETLNSQVSCLDERLKDLEKLEFADQHDINSLIKDIETIKKYIEAYNMAMVMTHRNLHVNDEFTICNK